MPSKLRDKVSDGTDDNQDRIPLKEHDKIVGHAVRSNYLYAGVTDLYLEDGDEEYFSMLHKVFRSMADKKMYLTEAWAPSTTGLPPMEISLSISLFTRPMVMSISSPT